MHFVTFLRGTSRAVSFVLFLKGVMGFAVLALALFGVTVPFFGFETSIVGSGVAATVGAIFGGLLALKA
jgi:hypothetical protein